MSTASTQLTAKGYDQQPAVATAPLKPALPAQALLASVSLAAPVLPAGVMLHPSTTGPALLPAPVLAAALSLLPAIQRPAPHQGRRRPRPAPLLAAEGTHWTAAEKARFADAEEKFGPFAWSDLTAAVRTRSMKQVKAFSARLRHSKRCRRRAAAKERGAARAATPTETTATAGSGDVVGLTVSGSRALGVLGDDPASNSDFSSVDSGARARLSYRSSARPRTMARLRVWDTDVDSQVRPEEDLSGEVRVSEVERLSAARKIHELLSDIESDVEHGSSPKEATERCQPIRKQLEQLLNCVEEVSDTESGAESEPPVIAGVVIDFDDSDLVD